MVNAGAVYFALRVSFLATPFRLSGNVEFRMFLTIVDLGSRSSKTPENEYRRSDNCYRHGEKSHRDKALLPWLTAMAG